MAVSKHTPNWLRVLCGIRQICEIEGCNSFTTGYVHFPGFHKVLCEEHAQTFSNVVLKTYREVLS